MTHSTVTHTEALRRLVAATKLIDYADCKDETVWQALGAAQGTAEGVLRDGEKQETVAWAVYAANGNPRIYAWVRNNDLDKSEVKPLYAAPQPAAAPSGDTMPVSARALADNLLLAVDNLGYAEGGLEGLDQLHSAARHLRRGLGE